MQNPSHTGKAFSLFTTKIHLCGCFNVDTESYHVGEHTTTWQCGHLYYVRQTNRLVKAKSTLPFSLNHIKKAKQELQWVTSARVVPTLRKWWSREFHIIPERKQNCPIKTRPKSRVVFCSQCICNTLNFLSTFSQNSNLCNRLTMSRDVGPSIPSLHSAAGSNFPISFLPEIFYHWRRQKKLNLGSFPATGYAQPLSHACLFVEICRIPVRTLAAEFTLIFHFL